MKVAMFTDVYWPRVNGVTVSVDSFSRALIKAGHSVLIVCSQYPESYDFKASSIDAESEEPREAEPLVLRIPSIPAFFTKEDRVAKINKWYWVFKQVESFGPEVLHINTEMMIAGFGFFYARTHNLPAIYTFHTMWEDYAPNYLPMFPTFIVKILIRGWQKSILKNSYRVIVPTTQIEEVVRRYDQKVETFLLPTGIDPALFCHDRARVDAFREKLEAKYPGLRGKRILLFVGRVAKEKNIGFLLKIMPAILAKHPDTILLIAGNGPDLEPLKNEAAALGIKDSCFFPGYLERKDLSLVYAISHVFVFPSLTDTQGLVTLEAMFSGIPVVAIGAMGTLMVMGGDNGGFMVKNDPAEFTARVLELLGDDELYRNKAAEAKECAKPWSIEEITRKLADFYAVLAASYRKEYGEPCVPVWDLITDKRWWKTQGNFFRKANRLKQQKPGKQEER